MQIEIALTEEFQNELGQFAKRDYQTATILTKSFWTRNKKKVGAKKVMHARIAIMQLFLAIITFTILIYPEIGSNTRGILLSIWRNIVSLLELM